MQFGIGNDLQCTSVEQKKLLESGSGAMTECARITFQATFFVLDSRLRVISHKWQIAFRTLFIELF
jgi:hypothetical protein